MTLAQELVEFAWDLPDLPAGVQHAVRRHLLDGLGNAVASARAGVVAPAVEVATALGGAGEAAVWATGGRVSAPAAALANGALVHGLDFDDTHAGALVHATAVLAPAAIAVGEQHAATGRELVAALAGAYESVLRLGAAVQHGFHARGFHATSVVGVFGAALAAARLSGLDRGQAVHALGIAGSQAAGSLEFLVDGVSTKQLHPGMAAMNGVLAARLAAAGATGPDTILEGEAGLFGLYAGASPDPADVTRTLGEEWELERITIKPYPVCQLSHAAMDAVASVRAQVDPDDVAEMVVALPHDSVPIVAEPAHRKARPQSTYDARFSLPFCLAVVLDRGGLGVDDLGPDQLDDPRLQALAATVTVVPSEPTGPAAAAEGRVTVRLHDGRTVVGHVPASRGGPDRPLTDDELVEKFVSNTGGAPAADAVARRVLDMDPDEAVGALVPRVVGLGAADPHSTTTGASR